MALDESVDGLVKLESNGIEAYIEPGLREFLEQFEQISVDYVSRGEMTGFAVTVGKDSSGCGSGGCNSGSCGT
jgi:Fe-S cluster assembly iron-binding protein IscA